MILGFTGTRTMPTEDQITWLETQLQEAGVDQLHHGACVGADACAHRLAVIFGIWVVVHPPINQRLVDGLALQLVSDRGEVLPPKHYGARNRDIVDASDRMLALPNTPYRPGSGTWDAIGYARGTGVPVSVCYPDGLVTA